MFNLMIYGLILLIAVITAKYSVPFVLSRVDVPPEAVTRVNLVLNIGIFVTVFVLSYFILRAQGIIFPSFAVANTTSVKTPLVAQTIFEVDGETITKNDAFQTIVCDASARVELILLDDNRARISPDDFFYNWRFEPGDQSNQDKLNSSNYVVIYQAPCELNSQTIFVEVEWNKKTLFTKSLRFKIEE